LSLGGFVRIAKKSTTGRVFRIAVAVLVAVFCFSSVGVQAQTQGNNAVYPQSGTMITGSSAYIDASVWDGVNTKGDVCADIWDALNSVLSGNPPMAVVDARGIPKPSTGFSCSATPWTFGGTIGTLPSVILLPAGVIPMQTAWVLPDKTRIIGQGADPNGLTGTILQWPSSSPSSVYMITFGSTIPNDPFQCTQQKNSNTYICNGMGVENLTLDGHNHSTVNGIKNITAQERSYVDHVSFVNFNGTGLCVGTGGTTVCGGVTTGGQGTNSGPYSNMTFLAGTGGGTPTCAEIVGNADTRGIHNFKCTGPTNPIGTAGIYLDASGNSLEDISVSNFTDGIRIGQKYKAIGNVLRNVAGVSNITNVVHIYNTNTVSDLSLLQVNKGGANYTVEDDTIPAGSGGFTQLIDQAAIYAIGEPMSGGLSRFTTSTKVPAWLVGSGTPSTNCAVGTLYSDTSTSDSTTLWVCTALNTWTNVD
jgi:hypothetical protein